MGQDHLGITLCGAIYVVISATSLEQTHEYNNSTGTWVNKQSGHLLEMGSISRVKITE